ncbi:hypothetical protein [Herbaspirillum sp. CAH-3]|uniref:hypothetical protein n=1 Tax=Herbaspirillum sp. CAH-3 TaxID=2605746 RepID=UPI0012AD1FE1|nr:hypothetical protein [Herbaspirillum sp. CAH-3]MRT30409.1 hypothetical protein [Herbaspirillum sp. CAH-3]
MINDPIPLVDASRVIRAIIVATFPRTDHLIQCTFATTEDRFLTLCSSAVFGYTPELGECWQLSGQWNRNEDIGDYLDVEAAQPAIPHDSTICIWLQLNVLGMGSWYPKQLWRKFGYNLAKLLNNFDYEELTKISKHSRRFPYPLLLDACVAWSSLVRLIEFLDTYTHPRLRALALHDAQLASPTNVIQGSHNPYGLARFASFRSIDSILNADGKLDQAEDRLLSAVDAVISEHYARGYWVIAEDRMVGEVSALLLGSENQAKQAINFALSKKALVQSTSRHYQGTVSRSLEIGISARLKERGQISHLGGFLNSVDLVFAASCLPRISENAQILRVASCDASLDDIFEYRSEAMRSVCFVSVHAERLRLRFPESLLHVYSPGEVSRELLTNHQKPELVVLWDAQTYSLALWAHLLQAIPTSAQIVVCGADYDRSHQSIWNELQSAPHDLDHSQEAAPSIFDLFRVLSSGGEISSLQYQKSLPMLHSHVDVPADRCTDAAVGISHQQNSQGLCTQIFCSDSHLRDILNDRMQSANQQVRTTFGRSFGHIAMFEGDQVFQPGFINSSLPPNNLATISRIYSAPEVHQGPDNNLLRVHLQVRSGQESYELTLRDAEALNLGYALPARQVNTRGVDVAIVVAPTPEQFDIEILRTAVDSAARHIIFVGLGLHRMATSTDHFSVRGSTSYLSLQPSGDLL